ncbi:MAG: LamG domain-containing protein, partial [Planctomycetales bacterium]|nr:LamG domain-containing protein [Planctomycetales bacterium]
FLRLKLAQAIAEAEKNLEPADVGWGLGNAADYTALRRWILRPDRMTDDPFGNQTVRAASHAGRVLDNVTGESGPEDPDLSLISFRAKDGRPIALLANFSMHYFGDRALSADYFGRFCEGIQQKLSVDRAPEHPPLVALMSHGCSGDIYRVDYRQPEAAKISIEQYTDELLAIALSAYQDIQYDDQADLAMGETRMELDYRVPDQQRLEWAERIVAAMPEPLPQNTTEVYAREQLLLAESKATQVVVQALRIGDIAIATTPTETYALTGLKLKRQSPLPQTMVIELANGGDGYIPPPEQHALGGYNTWAARSAGLEVSAEPKITAAALELLESVAGKPRRSPAQSRGPAADAILQAQPCAYWRMDEMQGPRAVDTSENGRDALYETGVAFFLDGPRSSDYCVGSESNRAAHFAGGRLETRLPELQDRYSVALWFWNGMPLDGRPFAGWMLSRGNPFGLGAGSHHLGLGGTTHPGKLVVQTHASGAPPQLFAGSTNIDRWSWNHVVLLRDGSQLRVHLNGQAEPEIVASLEAGDDFPAARFPHLFIGGRSDNHSNWEGRIDEVAVFDRVLSPAQIAKLL